MVGTVPALGALAYKDKSRFTADLIVAKDGTGDYKNIQTAIDNLNENESIFVKSGEYLRTDSLVFKTNMELRLSPFAVVKQADGINLDHLLEQSDEAGGNDNIRIVGGKFDVNVANNPTGGGNVLYMPYISNLLLDTVEFVNTKNGIAVGYGDYNKILNCKIDKTILGDGMLIEGCNHLRLEHTKIWNTINAAEDQGGTGLMIDGCSWAKIIDVDVYKSYVHGISIIETAAESRHNDIIGVTSRFNHEHGLNLNAYYNNVIGGFYYDNSHRVGGSDYGGICLVKKYCTVTGAQCSTYEGTKHQQYGIRIFGIHSVENRLENCICENNILDGISITKDDNYVINCRCKGNANGIHLYSGASGNEIFHNDFRGNTTNAINDEGSGNNKGDNKTV